MITFREWLAEREELEEAIDLSDPDKSVSYETFAKAYTDSNTRNIGELKIIQKFFKAKEEPFKQEYRGNTYTYIAPLFESKDKKFKIFIETPSSTDGYDTYNVVVADKYMHASFYHKISLNIKEFKKLNNKIIIEGLKELYNKSLAKYENDDYYKKIGKFVFKPNFMNLIK